MPTANSTSYAILRSVYGVAIDMSAAATSLGFNSNESMVVGSVNADSGRCIAIGPSLRIIRTLSSSSPTATLTHGDESSRVMALGAETVDAKAISPTALAFQVGVSAGPDAGPGVILFALAGAQSASSRS